MLTDTTPLARTSSAASACLELPFIRPPPWMNTYTGRPASGAVPAGRCTFTTKQSSVSERGPLSPSVAGHGLPNAVAGRTRSTAGPGRGGAQRRSPTGGAAYGMPRKLSTPRR